MNKKTSVYIPIFILMRTRGLDRDANPKKGQGKIWKILKGRLGLRDPDKKQ